MPRILFLLGRWIVHMITGDTDRTLTLKAGALVAAVVLVLAVTVAFFFSAPAAQTQHRARWSTRSRYRTASC
jgi:hypothetical protein